MKRVIVDYAKLTNEILTLLVEKFPDGYDDSDIIRFKNAKNESIEAVEVKTEDTIYLVKVSTKLADRIENFDEEDEEIIPEAINVKDIDDLDEEDDMKPKKASKKSSSDTDEEEDDDLDEDDDEYRDNDDIDEDDDDEEE